MSHAGTRYGSDVLVELLSRIGIEHVALNPGATFRGLHDSLAQLDSAPEIVTCLHEEIAVAVAHGYAKAAGRPMAAAVHDVVGLQHACMAIYNAWCDRVPILLLGGTGPVAADLRRPWIDWIHTALVQGSHVRDFVKWDDQPASVPAAVESVIRAHKLAITHPFAPTYVCLPVEVQEGPARDVALPDLAAFAPGRPGPDPDAIKAAEAILRKARSPVIVLERAADHPGAPALAAELATELGAALVDLGARMNVANDHPLDLSGAEADVLASADAILAVEVLDLEGALGDRAPAEARRIHVSLADALVGSWTADYQRLPAVEVPIMADAALALDALLQECRGADRERATRRADQLRAIRERVRAEWDARAAAERDVVPISLSRLADEVRAALDDRPWILAHGTLNGWARRRWTWSDPGCYLGTNGGAGIGYGAGATIGAALAHRGDGRLIVNLQPDGDLLFTPSALWTMANLGLPILNVVWNNRSYYNSQQHAERVARYRGRDMGRTSRGIAIRGPDIDFAGMASAYGLWARGPVTDPSELQGALRAAVAEVAAGRPALVDVVTQAR
jgi:thiamine pyrophosphate-dependent acetolactate synthase large subunit-like protein